MLMQSLHLVSVLLVIEVNMTLLYLVDQLLHPPLVLADAFDGVRSSSLCILNLGLQFVHLQD